MAELKAHLEKLDYTQVKTYINSGNVIVQSAKKAADIKNEVEQILLANFVLDSKHIKVLVLSHAQLASVVKNKPKGFGEQPEIYHSDAIFLINYEVSEAIKVFNPREGVDTVWPGEGVVYSQRLSAERTKSRLSKIMSTEAYDCMTIRSWSTTTKLLALLDATIN